MVKPRIGIFWLPALMLYGLVACNRGVPVSIENRSGTTLERVVIAGSGFRQELGKIPRDMTVTTRVRPSGESGIEISFRSRGRSVTLPSEGYFEGAGYTVTVVIAPDGSATIDALIRYK